VDPTNLSTIAKWAGGELLRGEASLLVTRICTDSRALKAGDLFLALRGENFDGHAFAGQAAKLGAAGVIVDSVPEGLPENFPVIKVVDTLIALQQIAANYRRSLPLKAVVITGSNGKTSTKDFAAAVLEERFQVIKTEGNLNNHIGLPLTILRAGKSDEIGVFEIGMNHPGEIAPLAGDRASGRRDHHERRRGAHRIHGQPRRDRHLRRACWRRPLKSEGGCVVLECGGSVYTPSIAGTHEGADGALRFRVRAR
jgi:hypothetical protein